MDNAENKREYWKLHVNVTGRKARARSLARHSVDIGEFESVPDLDAVRPQIEASVRGFLAKGSEGVVTRVCFEHQIETKESGFTKIRWSPFGEKNQRHDVEWRV